MIHYLILGAVYIALCMLVAFIGRRRKWGYWGYLWSSVLFTPALGFMFVLAADAPPKRPRASAGGKAGDQGK
ncbi:MAG: hypothetical protein N838_01385 [Thiohalocapsa sp. PB-PSB1]|jgi:hypothetical protein|nr:MAG: hypothetical protein N838_17230 [Thiohalocapsa sp. PB-PSB1]QQO52232.1 MAG: hypothetical protein N838_01385 [Thiohalocapsa sp. PB-PSB1]HCS92532.1 hypothetical protein [Chromatiaceae bacterium]